VLDSGATRPSSRSSAAPSAASSPAGGGCDPEGEAGPDASLSAFDRGQLSLTDVLLARRTHTDLVPAGWTSSSRRSPSGTTGDAARHDAESLSLGRHRALERESPAMKGNRRP
jgi:hypothetical protein